MDLLKSITVNTTTISLPASTMNTTQSPTLSHSYPILHTIESLSQTWTFTILSRLLILSILLYTAHLIHQDYLHFLSLGPGGTPSTPLGYLKIKLLSLLILRDPYSPPRIPSHFRPQTGYLSHSSFPKRFGKRPLVQGIAPQRQQTEQSTAEIYRLLASKISGMTRDPSHGLIERTSCFEKHSTGLFTSKPLTHTCRGEICHAHPSDGSMHLVLHPADSRVLLESGWGERHPLAHGGWFRRFVPKEFVMVYAPRNEEEVETVLEVIRASVWWVSGIDVAAKSGAGEMKGREREREVTGAEDWDGAGKECWSCRMKGCGGEGRRVVGAEKMVGKA